MTARDPTDEFVAFISYAQRDNEDKRISELRRQLEGELAVQADRERRIFMSEVIPAGQSWPDQLQMRLEEARVFIPILSPSYFESTWGQEEARFALGKKARSILPILYVDFRQRGATMRPGAWERSQEFENIAWLDLQDFRDRGLKTPNIKARIRQLARRILEMSEERDGPSVPPIVPLSPEPTPSIEPPQQSSDPAEEQLPPAARPPGLSDDEIVRIVIGGSDSIRRQLIDRIDKASNDVDFSSLIARVKDELANVSSDRAHRLEDPKRAPLIRGWLLSLLSPLARKMGSASDLLAHYLDHKVEPEEDVRFWALLALTSAPERIQLSLLARYETKPRRPLADAALAVAILVRIGQVDMSDLTQLVEGAPEELRWRLLRALRRFPVRGTVQSIVRCIQPTGWQPLYYDAICALAQPRVVAEAASTLRDAFSAERVVDLVVTAAIGTDPEQLAQLAHLLRPSDATLLERGEAGADAKRAEAERWFLAQLGNEAVALARIDNDQPGGTDHLRWGRKRRRCAAS